MKISVMKHIDEYFGRVLISLLSVMKNFSGRKKKIIPDKIKNILFIKFWGIGSIVLTAPSVKTVKENFPASKIYYLTLSDNNEICKELHLINEIVTISLTHPVSFVLQSIKAVKRLRKINFDLVIDFEFYTYFSALVVAVIKSKYSIGFDNMKNQRKRIFTKTIPFNDSIHTVNNFFNLVSHSNGSVEKSGKIIFPDISNGFKSNGTVKIIINPNASKLAYERRLPREYFIDIIDHLTENFKVKILLTGAEDETEYVNSIRLSLSNSTHVENFCGRTSLRELISLIQSSACLITNDSGPLHIASALDIPVIAFFGPESPVRYGPLSSKKLVFYNNLNCSPCMSISNSKTVNCIFDSPRCMESFDVKKIIERIDKFLFEILQLKEKTFKDAERIL